MVVPVPAPAITDGQENLLDPPTFVDAGPVTYEDVIRFAFLGPSRQPIVDDQRRPLKLGRQLCLANGDQVDRRGRHLCTLVVLKVGRPRSTRLSLA